PRMPASPSPATRSCWPSSMPGGMVSVISRSLRSRPSPRQRAQTLSTVLPAPPHRGQVETLTNRPKTDCCTCRTSPRPLQVGQVDIEDPGSAPDPLHRSQVSSRGTVTTRSRPWTASRRSISISMRRSAPRIGPRGSRRRRSPPKNVSQRSPTSSSPSLSLSRRMDVVFRIAVQWLHVTSAVLWIGGGFYTVLVQLPALLATPAPARGAALAQFVPRQFRYIFRVAEFTIVTGLLN